MTSENNNQRRVWLALGKMSRLFRLNTGIGWVSGMGPKGVQRFSDGSVLIKAARTIPLGFGGPDGKPVKGACDLPGWTSVEVTQDMVGHRIAVFTSIEVKNSKGGRTGEDQLKWMNQVIAQGGIAGVANSPEIALSVVSEWYKRFKLK